MYKKKKSKWWIWLLLLIFIVAVAGGIFWFQKNNATKETVAQEIVVGDNQELLQIRITKMLGNEMTGQIITDNQAKGEEKNWQIPVGTEVVTKLGTTTTFARLGSGDRIQMLIENGDSEEILKIWISQ